MLPQTSLASMKYPSKLTKSSSDKKRITEFMTTKQHYRKCWIFQLKGGINTPKRLHDKNNDAGSGYTK